MEKWFINMSFQQAVENEVEKMQMSKMNGVGNFVIVLLNSFWKAFSAGDYVFTCLFS